MDEEGREFWRGYHSCRDDLRKLLEKIPSWSPESRLALVLSFLMRDSDLDETHDRPE